MGAGSGCELGNICVAGSGYHGRHHCFVCLEGESQKREMMHRRLKINKKYNINVEVRVFIYLFVNDFACFRYHVHLANCMHVATNPSPWDILLRSRLPEPVAPAHLSLSLSLSLSVCILIYVYASTYQSEDHIAQTAETFVDRLSLLEVCPAGKWRVEVVRCGW